MSAMDLADSRLLVTPGSYGRGGVDLRARLVACCREVIFNDTGKPMSSSQLREALHDVDGYIAGLDDVSAEALEAANRLKVISRYGVGVDNVDLTEARSRGIVVTNTPGANSVSVAELTIGLILSLLRRVPQAVAAARSGGWPRMTGASLRGKTVGIVGYGAIGREAARRLRPFGCRIVAHDPYRTSFDEGVTGTGLQELAESSDIVSLHVPATDATRGMVDARFLASMKNGAFLVNTARGELIVEEALVDAIQRGHIAGAAIDVFDREPPAGDNPLLAMEQVLVTPHMAAHSDDAINAMGEMATDDCLAVLRGEKPKHPVRM